MGVYDTFIVPAGHYPTPPAQPSPLVALMRVAQGAFDAYTIVKAGTIAGTVTQLAALDDPILMTGVALGPGVDGHSVLIEEVDGVAGYILSDGTTVIAPGDTVTSSDTVAGRCKKGVNDIIGSALSSAAAVLNTPVIVL